MIYPTITSRDMFYIDDQVRAQFPTLKIGVAILHKIKVASASPELSQTIAQFVQSQQGLTNEDIGAYPEIQSYRELYRQMHVDWHSKRPSPEALLRRISRGKSLYQINNCVDAYNLVVMKNRVSVGAFDLKNIILPTLLRFATTDDQILLLGDEEITMPEPTELVYADQTGGYNIDLNYRDAQRTAVTDQTTDILINVDGVGSIGRDQVEKVLAETIELIQKNCGGSLDMVGIVEATI